MNIEAQPTLSIPTPDEAPPIIRPNRASPSSLRRTLIFPLKFFWGMVFCQSLVGSILVVGWTYRLAQRSALKYWWSRSPRAQSDGTFAEFLDQSRRTRDQRHWPNWFVEQNFAEGMRVRRQGRAGVLASPLFGVESTPQGCRDEPRGSVSALGHSLWLNFWIGLRAIANTWLLTLPAGLLWWFGWYDGWNNSFNKGYEQALVGPLISIFGIVWFIAAMFYVPLAQARQAATGEWRTFFQFRLVWQIVRFRSISSAGLALLYSVFALPLSILKTVPMFQPQMNPVLAGLTDEQVLKHLDAYFFWCALAVLPAYVVLRLVAARIYANGILTLARSGQVGAGELSELEFESLERLGLLESPAQPERNRFVRFVAWTGTRVGKIIGSLAVAVIWFIFVAQIYIAQFLNYHGAPGWLNQPFVQLPWFHHLPARLRNPMEAVFLGLLAWFVALSIRWVWRAFRQTRAADPNGDRSR